LTRNGSKSYKVRSTFARRDVATEVIPKPSLGQNRSASCLDNTLIFQRQDTDTIMSVRIIFS